MNRKTGCSCGRTYSCKECKNMKNKEKMPEWDLSEYYNGVDDPKIGEVRQDQHSL